MDALFHTPEFYGLSQQYAILNDFYLNYPEIFFERRKIFTVYGCFPNMLWNGGRAVLGFQNSLCQADELMDFYHTCLNFPLTFTMTNLLIEEKHLQDTYCNEIMKLAERYDGMVLVANDLLEEHIRDNYPDLKIIRSVCKAANDKIPYDLDDKYFLSVLDRNYNNTSVINEIPEDKRHKIELLCNDTCFGCEKYSYHHKHECLIQMLKIDMNSPFNCANPTDFTYYNLRNHSAYISPLDIDDYLDKGYCHFKIVGRDGTLEAVNSLVEYFILPEYRTDIQTALLGSMIK